MSGESGGNLAGLIDADNVSSKIIAGLMAEVANYGTASVRRIYGDWTSPLMKSWRERLLEYSISPIQQFAYTTGKNATDGAIIIDAMDLLYTGRFSAFSIVSSDSDFTRLAARIREQAITVYGFGNRNTNSAFVSACNKFVYFDALPMPPEEPEFRGHIPEMAHKSFSPGNIQQSPGSQEQMAPKGPKTFFTSATLPSNTHQTAHVGSDRREFDQYVLAALRSAINTSAIYEGDYVNLAEVGIKLTRISPSFNPRNYGFERLKDFVQASGIVDLQMKLREPHPPIALVRLKG